MIAICLVAYCLITMLGARWAYSAMRAYEISRSRYHEFDTEDAIANGVMALMAGVLWPVALVVAAVIYKPRKTPEELRDELAERDRRIRELEKELGIR